MHDFPFLAQAMSEVIERLRTERKMTKSALADFACLERHHLRNIEQMAKKPTVNATYWICNALGVKPADFFQMVDDRVSSLKNMD